jgi:putative DNA primase/helicase
MALLHCHAGCTPGDIVAACDLTMADLFPPKAKTPKPERRIVASYDYCDEHGAVLFQSVRFEPKDFLQRHRAPGGTWVWNIKGVRRVLYRLPALQGHPCAWVCEGERDADALAALGFPATTNPAGAGKWRPEYTKQLQQSGVTKVVILPDNDIPGAKHGQAVATACAAAGMDVKVVVLAGVPDHGDVSDWLAMGHSSAELLALVKAHPRWQPPADPVPSAVAVSAQAPLAATCFPLTDLGAAEFFADRYGSRVRFDHRRGRWLIWNGLRWAPDADAQIYRLCGEHLRQWQRDALNIPERERRQRVVEYALRLERRGGMENILAVAKGLKPIASTGHEWDLDLYLLGVENGVIDLRAGTHRPGAPADMITMSAKASYDAQAVCPQWDAFLTSVLPDDDLRVFVRRFVGYALTGNTDEQVLAMLYGKGSNGKSTLLSTLVDVFGDYAATIAFSALEFKRSDIPNDIANLQHVRFVMASEVKEGQRLNEARIKALTGGDTISARHLYSEWFSFKPAAKFFLAVNHKPMVADDSYGFWRRIRLVPFRQFFTGSDRVADLPQRLLEERDGILRWAVEGCLEWQRERLNLPLSILDASAEYQAESDPLADFLVECCEADTEAETKAHVVYSTYSKWAESRRIPKPSVLQPTAFGLRFSDKFEKERRASGVVYRGVRIITERLFS